MYQLLIFIGPSFSAATVVVLLSCCLVSDLEQRGHRGHWSFILQPKGLNNFKSCFLSDHVWAAFHPSIFCAAVCLKIRETTALHVVRWFTAWSSRLQIFTNQSDTGICTENIYNQTTIMHNIQLGPSMMSWVDLYFFIEAIHPNYINSIKGYGSTQDVIDGPHCISVHITT